MADRDRQREYWRNRKPQPVARNPLIVSLAWPAPRAAAELGTCRFTLPARVAEDLLRVCNGSDLSLYILLVTLYKAVAARHSGDAEVTLLAPGYSVGADIIPAEMVMFQDGVQLSEDVRSNALETRRTIVGAYSNQEVTLAELHGPELAAAIVAGNPFCSSSNLHPHMAHPPSCPLELRFARREQELSCTITYDAARLRPDLAGEFCANLQQLIEAASTDYTVPLERVGWLRGERLERVLAFSKGPLLETPDASLHELFAEQARKTPEAPALLCGSQSVTYAQLEAMAEAAAGRLVALGVEPGARIALRLPGGIDLVAALLGVLKAGAAFVPISLSDPPNRVDRLLGRCPPRLLVGTFAGVPRVDVADLVAPGPGPGRATAGTAAYVMFTSGTSGEPKGVVIEHRGIVNAIAWKMREYAFSPRHRVLPLFGYEFDGFVLNLFAPLCAGAAVVLLDDEERRHPARIAAAVGTRGVTHLAAAPLLYDALLDHATQLRSLERVTLAGEVAHPDTIARGRRLAPHVHISNEYGPTEGSVVSTHRRELSAESVNVIGRPIANVSVYVRDERGDLVPPGVVGEIFLGGRGLARGYLGEDGDDAFSHWNGERLYRTGDLGRWLPDGEIEFRGRRERYVKVRGRRVDLEEIRGAITKQVAVRDALVLHVGDSTDGMLVAFVVAESLEGLDASLRRELPPHLVPGRLLRLDALPLGAGGKLDVAALRARLHEPWTVAPPGNDVERRLIDIWRRVLETERVGVDDSFFALGGHSLRAVRLLTEIHGAFGVELQLSQIFSAHTVRRLAAIVASAPRERAEEQPPETSEHHALSSAQGRMLALTQEHPVSYNLPVLFALDGNLDLPRLRLALRYLMERHDSLRASFHLVNDKWVQRIGEAGEVPLTVRALDGDIDDAAQAALAPFDLRVAPLFRVVLFTANDRHTYLLFDFHHISIDEVSLALLFRELGQLYDGERLTPPAWSYAAYARWQQRQRASKAYRAQLQSAAEHLRGVELEPLRLPFDFPPPRKRSHSGGLVRQELPRNLVAAARDLCASCEVTEFMFFMAVLSLLLHKYTHQSTIVVGAPVSLRVNRTRDLVGLFLNTVPFKMRVPPGEATFEAHLHGVAAAVIDDLGRSQVEFDDLVKALKIERQFGENPLFDVILNMVDAGATQLSLQGVAARHRPLHNGTSKFDLVLELDLAETRAGFALEFSTERFRRSTVEQLSDSLVTLLEQVVAHPAAALSTLQVLRPAQREQLLEWGGAASVGSYEGGSLVSLFESRVRERPSDVALVFGDERVTYGDLNARANRLARKLCALGCGEDQVVAVFCERSLAAIAGILAVQKAGAAHLPLDPFYPITRTGKMLADSGARLLITDQDPSALQFGGAVIRIDADLSDLSAADLGLPRRPESLAYVLYTSGTTGGPKGVMVEQRNIVTLVQRATSDLAIDHRDVWTLFHSLCFDVSVWEMFGSLLRGSRLVIVPRAIAADPERVLDVIEKNRVTVLCQPPSAFYLLADAMVRGRRPTSLRYVVLGGEAIKAENLKSWCGRYGQAN